MLAIFADIVFCLESTARLSIAFFDGLTELVDRIGCCQHGGGMRTDHVQLTFGQASDVIAMVDDAGMQPPMIFVIVADIHGCQNLASCPRSLALDHQHRARALTQKFPVTWRQQRLAQGVVRPVFLDH
ncbi:hypothetical protein D3C81_1428110 [compost metagenome]